MRYAVIKQPHPAADPAPPIAGIVQRVGVVGGVIVPKGRWK